VLFVEVFAERLEQLVTARRLLRVRLRVGEDEVFAHAAPEEVLDEPHRGGLGPEHRLGVFDQLAVPLRKALHVAQVGHS
jgi:hypothetical protein